MTRPKRPAGLPHVGLLLSAAAAPLIAIVVFLGGSGSHDRARATAAVHPAAPARVDRPPPPADHFARLFVGLTDAYAQAHNDTARIARPHCVEAARGRYMCSYAVVKPPGPRTCHLMQARWTPRLPSTFTVTLASRTGKCGSLREAIRSLQ